MKNNKGFTIMELILAFSITIVVGVLLFELTISLKNLYVKSGIKTELLIKQANVNKKIYDDLSSKKIIALNDCGEDCVAFEFSDNSIKQLKINHKTNILNYGNYGMEATMGSEYGEAHIKYYTNYGNLHNEIDSYLKIIIPVIHPMYEDEDFGINIIYQYNSNDTYLIGVDF